MEGKPMSVGFLKKEFTNDFFQYEKHDKAISVVGRLKRHIAYWRTIECSEFILKVIQNGYVIPVMGEVDSVHLRNNRSSRIEPEFVRRSIDELLDNGAIVECTTKPYVANPLTVAHKNGKKRLVIDMRHINDRLKKARCKYDNHDVAQQFYTRGGFMTVFDLKSGYHHIEVAEAQHELLGFAYEDSRGKLRFFKFVVLPFGLATAGYIFTKVLRELIRHWRSMQIQALVFLDDGLQTNKDFATTSAHAMQIKGSLLMAGWVPHRSKSVWVPTQVMPWLGFTTDLVAGTISANEERINNAKKLITEILCMKKVHIRKLAQVKGMIASMERSHGDIVHLMTRFLNLAISEGNFLELPGKHERAHHKRTEILAKKHDGSERHANFSLYEHCIH